MTRLPKSGRSPSSDSRRRARTREVPPGSSASHFSGSRQPLAAGQSSAWRAQWAYLFVYLFILLFFFFFSQLGKPSPPTLAHPPLHRRGAGGSPWGFVSSFSRLYGGAGKASGTVPAPVPVPQFPHAVGSGDFPIGTEVTSGCALRPANSSCKG